MTNNYDSLMKVLHQDALFAGVDTTLKGRIKRLIHPSYCFRYIELLRKCDFYSNHRNYFYRLYGTYLKIKCHRLSVKLGFYIPKNVYGPGLYIPHYGSIIVNPNAKIGSNCQINNNVVIGQVKGKCPRIGNNVFIGFGAVICGDVTIGDNVWIGANSVVTKNIKDGVMAAGVPAKIISKKDNNWVDEFFSNINQM